MSNPHFIRPWWTGRDVLKGAAALVVGATLTAVREFADMLGPDHREHGSQRWFAKNNWIIGISFRSFQGRVGPRFRRGHSDR
jgi:hypothetical protein